MSAFLLLVLLAATFTLVAHRRSAGEQLSARKPRALLPMTRTTPASQVPAVFGFRFLLLAAATNLCFLMVLAGVAMLGYGLIGRKLGSPGSWALVSAGFGCLVGGAGGLGGIWNTYRRWQGARDIWREPGWTWLDGVIIGYGSAGAIGLLTSAALWRSLDWNIAYPIALLSGIVAFQGGVFLVIRVLMRQRREEPPGCG